MSSIETRSVRQPAIARSTSTILTREATQSQISWCAHDENFFTEPGRIHDRKNSAVAHQSESLIEQTDDDLW